MNRSAILVGMAALVLAGLVTMAVSTLTAEMSWSAASSSNCTRTRSSNRWAGWPGESPTTSTTC